MSWSWSKKYPLAGESGGEGREKGAPQGHRGMAAVGAPKARQAARSAASPAGRVGEGAPMWKMEKPGGKSPYRTGGKLFRST